MDLTSLSKIIKNEREKREISFEKIHQETKIPIKFLKYIEDDKWENFPSDAHKKAVLKKYLNYLKIEVGIDNLFKKEEEVDKENDVEKRDVESSEREEKKLNRKVCFVIILFVVFLTLFFIANHYIEVILK
ncbi:MAG: helix-turn-helix domain-containing protein [Candidatus Omnitrophica bacterium]|nr:helix-turn-helix domain-containing protein [Candidatus Omnitrophota bacterium]